MASSNASRASMARNVSAAVSGAKLIGFDNDGRACIWFGGYVLQVYDVARDWSEVESFNSSQLMAIDERDSEEGYGYARTRMKAEGFQPVE